MRSRAARIERIATLLRAAGEVKAVDLMVRELRAAGFSAQPFEGNEGLVLGCDVGWGEEKVARRNALLSSFDARGFGRVPIVMLDIYVAYTQTTDPFAIRAQFCRRDPERQRVSSFLASGDAYLFPPRNGAGTHSTAETLSQSPANARHADE